MFICRQTITSPSTGERYLSIAIVQIPIPKLMTEFQRHETEVSNNISSNFVLDAYAIAAPKLQIWSVNHHIHGFRLIFRWNTSGITRNDRNSFAKLASCQESRLCLLRSWRYDNFNREFSVAELANNCEFDEFTKAFGVKANRHVSIRHRPPRSVQTIRLR